MTDQGVFAMQDNPPFRPSAGSRVFFNALVILGCAATGIGLSSDPQRTRATLYLAGHYAIWIAVGALALIALDAVSGASWSLPLRRVQEAFVAVLPVAGLVLLGVLLWDPSLIRNVDDDRGAEGVSALRTFWLQRPFLLSRAAAYVGIWTVFAVLIVRAVRGQERTGVGAWSPSSVRLAAGFLVAFGWTCWLATYDWIMALQPGWSSTIFGVYNFSGSILSALAAVTLCAVTLRRFAPFRAALTAECRYNLGTLLFGFSSFWMYIWYCQYLLIWYTNHPQETSYFRERCQGVWLPYLLAALVLNWVVPFLALLPRRAKQSGVVLACVSLVVLVGRWVDLLVMIGPSQDEQFARPGLVEGGIVAGTVGLLGLCVLWSLAKLPLVPRAASDLLPDHRPRPATVVE
jgi:hypothetical protein